MTETHNPQTFDLLKCIAADNGWELAENQPDPHYLRFEKNGSLIDVWFSTGTIRYLPINSKPEYYKKNTQLDFERIIKI